MYKRQLLSASCVCVLYRAYGRSHLLVLQWKEKRILGMGQPPAWSSSVALDPSRLKNARTKSNSDLDPGKPYQYNYRAEALPPKSPHPVPRPHRVRVYRTLTLWLSLVAVDNIVEYIYVL